MTTEPRGFATHRLVSSFLSFLFWFLGFPKTMIYRFKQTICAESHWEEVAAAPLCLVHSL